MAYEVTLADYKGIVITMLLTMFICWAMQELMERCAGMSPIITKASAISHKSKKEENPLKHYKINKMLTKSLDVKGQFRIQTRGTIYFIKAIYQIFLFLTSLTVFIAYPNWFKDHFIHLKADTVQFLPLLHISGSILAFYAWEVIANRYGRLTWSVLVHHWFTAGMAAAVLMGRYSPFATWYGFTLVALDFPVFFTLGFRAQFSNQYPHFTRNAFRFSYYWWLFIIVLNMSGQIWLIIDALVFHFNESIHVAFIGIMLICIAAWLYDDYQVLKGLREFSTHDYEDADILNSENQGVSRNLGGRSLFAMAVVYDMEKAKVIPKALQQERTETAATPVTTKDTDREAGAFQMTALEVPLKPLTDLDHEDSADHAHADSLRYLQSPTVPSDALTKDKEHLRELVITASVLAEDTSAAIPMPVPAENHVIHVE